MESHLAGHLAMIMVKKKDAPIKKAIYLAVLLANLKPISSLMTVFLEHWISKGLTRDDYLAGMMVARLANQKPKGSWRAGN